MAKELDATFLAPENHGTCRSAAGKWSTIDWAIASRSLAWGIRSVTAIDAWKANPHIPVQLEFFEQLSSRWALVFPKAPAYPTKPLCGPVLPPHSFAEQLNLAKNALEKARAADKGEADKHITRAYAALMGQAEKQVARETGSDETKAGAWSRAAIPQWKRVYFDHTPAKEDEPAEVVLLDNLGWIQQALEDLAALTAKARSEAEQTGRWPEEVVKAKARLDKKQLWESAAAEQAQRWFRIARAHGNQLSELAGRSDDFLDDPRELQE